MHLTLLTLSLVGSLTLVFNPTSADKDADLGYMKCVSAVVDKTSFPSCTSTYKLDCFCEAQAQARSSQRAIQRHGHGQIDKNGNANLDFSNLSGSAPARAHLQLSPEVEDFCAENGVPKDEIARYLCDDTAVLISPRRGSVPMVKFEDSDGNYQHEISSSVLHLNHKEDEKEKEREKKEGEEVKLRAAKRAIQPEMTRLLIPVSEPVPENGDEKENAPNAETETGTEINKAGGEDETDPRLAKASAVYQVVTVTETRTDCTCATPVPGSPASDDEGSESEKKTPGAIHGTKIGVSTTVTEAEAEASSSASVRVASSYVSSTEAVPTGVDAEDHGLADSESEDEDEVAGEDEGKLFEGGAMSYGISRGMVMGVLGLAAGVVFL